MKSAYVKTNLKDNIAAATVLTATLVAILGTIVNSADARADHNAGMQQMKTIVVTAPRLEVARMNTIVVTTSREANILVAAN